MYKQLLNGLVFDVINSLIGDLNDEIILRTFVSNGYDIELGQSEIVYTNQTIKASCNRYQADEKDATVNLLTDERVLIPSQGLDNEPTENSVIIKDDGSVWEVKKVRKVPGNSLFIVHTRQVKPVI